MTNHRKSKRPIDCKVYRLANGWYSFGDVPQGYIKIDGLYCQNDKKALRQAKRIDPELIYEIVDGK